jgi:hypothetical protein
MNTGLKLVDTRRVQPLTANLNPFSGSLGAVLSTLVLVSASSWAERLCVAQGAQLVLRHVRECLHFVA